jgi:hypothetical protein
MRMREIMVAVLLLLNSAFVEATPLSIQQVEQCIRAAQTERPSFRDIPADLTNSPSFTALWKRPDEVSRHAKTLLTDPRLNADDKLVLVWALQNVRWPELFELYEWAFDSYTKGSLSPELVEELIFPGWDWNTRLQLRYKEPKVRDLLTRISKSALPQKQEWLRKYIPDILSGKVAEGIGKARRDGDFLDRNRKD